MTWKKIGNALLFPPIAVMIVLVPLATVLNALCVNPRRIFGLPGGCISEDEIADLTVLDVNRPHVIDSRTFRSLGRATPFDGWGVSAAVAMTVCGGEIVYADLRKQEESV